ncbi:MAG: hypothetical protein WDA27_02495 [Actinomycetota bacterium]
MPTAAGEIRRYRVQGSPVQRPEQDVRLAALRTVLFQSGVRIVAEGLSEDGHEITLVCQTPKDAREMPEDPGLPQLRLIERHRLHSLTPPEPFRLRLAEPDPQLVRPHAVPLKGVAWARDRTALEVIFERGQPEGLHHIEVVEGADRVTITVYLGTRPQGNRLVHPVLIRERAFIELQNPPAGRAIADGAWDG